MKNTVWYGVMSQLCDSVLLVAAFVEMFLNIHPQLHYIRYKQCNCGCNQPHIKCNLLKQ